MSLDQLGDGTAEAVDLINHHYVEGSPPGIGQQAVQAGPGGLGSGHFVFVDAGQFPAACGEVPKRLLVLQGGILVACGNSGVNSCSHVCLLSLSTLQPKAGIAPKGFA